MQIFSILGTSLGTQHCALKSIDMADFEDDDFETTDMVSDDDFEEPAPAGFEAIRVPDKWPRKWSIRRFTRALAARRSSQRRTHRDYN